MAIYLLWKADPGKFGPSMPVRKQTLRTCPQGHQYYKSTDCPSCPICEDARKAKDQFLSKLSALCG